jgi:hypothetical protein
MALVATAPAVDNIVDSGYIVSNIQLNENENNNMSVLSSRLDDLSDPSKWITPIEGEQHFLQWWNNYMKERGHDEYCRTPRFS